MIDPSSAPSDAPGWEAIDRDAPATDCSVFAVDNDPQLGAIPTPNGVVTFLQLIPVAAADKQRMLASSTAAVLAELRGPVRVAGIRSRFARIRRRR